MHLRRPSSKVAALYESSAKRKLPQPRLKVATFQCKSSTRTKLPHPHLKSQNFSQYKSSTRSNLGQPQLESRNLPVPKQHAKRASAAPAHLTPNIRENPAGKLHFLARKLEISRKLVSASWGLLLQRRILAATLSPRIPRPTLVCGHSARIAGKFTWFIIPASR